MPRLGVIVFLDAQIARIIATDRAFRILARIQMDEYLRETAEMLAEDPFQVLDLSVALVQRQISGQNQMEIHMHSLP